MTGDGSLPGENSLTLIVKGGEGAIEEEGREDKARGFHDARFGCTSTCLAFAVACMRVLEAREMKWE